MSNERYRLRPLVASLVIGFLFGLLSSSPVSAPRLHPEEFFAPLDAVYLKVRKSYYKDPGRQPSDDSLLDGAVEGLLDKLDDPYNSFYGPGEYERFRRRLEGRFVGIGVELIKAEEGLKIVAPLAGSPAERAGLSSGDLILEIDGRDTKGMAMEEVTELIGGEEGTEVRLKLKRPDGRTYEVLIERQPIEINSVEKELIGEGLLGYVKLSVFNRETAGKLRAVLEETFAQGVKGLILDLRSNPGGLLDVALSVASQFIDRGLIVKTSGAGEGEREYYSKGNDFPRLPLAVLIDDGTASAAEILAGAIKDNGAGTLIGERTFGKGLVQTVFNLREGYRLKLTTAAYETPRGDRVQGKGIEPDIKVGEERDSLEVAKKWLLQVALEDSSDTLQPEREKNLIRGGVE